MIAALVIPLICVLDFSILDRTDEEWVAPGYELVEEVRIDPLHILEPLLYGWSDSAPDLICDLTFAESSDGDVWRMVLCGRDSIHMLSEGHPPQAALRPEGTTQSWFSPHGDCLVFSRPWDFRYLRLSPGGKLTETVPIFTAGPGPFEPEFYDGNRALSVVIPTLTDAGGMAARASDGARRTDTLFLYDTRHELRAVIGADSSYYGWAQRVVYPNRRDAFVLHPVTEDSSHLIRFNADWDTLLVWPLPIERPRLVLRESPQGRFAAVCSRWENLYLLNTETLETHDLGYQGAPTLSILISEDDSYACALTGVRTDQDVSQEGIVLFENLGDSTIASTRSDLSRLGRLAPSGILGVGNNGRVLIELRDTSCRSVFAHHRYLLLDHNLDPIWLSPDVGGYDGRFNSAPCLRGSRAAAMDWAGERIIYTDENYIYVISLEKSEG